jgi:hypothetical protein
LQKLVPGKKDAGERYCFGRYIFAEDKLGLCVIECLGKARNYIRNFSPYGCLLLLGAPLAIVEPLKLAAIFIFGTGHWITGSVVMLLAYSVSLLVVERLFKIVKPKLLTLRWFVVIWTWFVATRDKAFRWFHTKLTYLQGIR